MEVKNDVFVVGRPVLAQVLEAIEDAIHELNEPEVAELTSMALDQKLADARALLQEITDGEA